MSNKEPKIDHEELKAVADSARDMVEQIRSVIDDLESNEDVFEKYMQYHKLKNLMKISEVSMEQFKINVRTGHDVGHDFFNTEARKENGWNDSDIQQNPFFANDDSEESDAIEEGLNGLKKMLDKLRAM